MKEHIEKPLSKMTIREDNAFLKTFGYTVNMPSCRNFITRGKRTRLSKYRPRFEHILCNGMAVCCFPTMFNTKTSYCEAYV